MCIPGLGHRVYPRTRVALDLVDHEHGRGHMYTCTYTYMYTYHYIYMHAHGFNLLIFKCNAINITIFQNGYSQHACSYIIKTRIDRLLCDCPVVLFDFFDLCTTKYTTAHGKTANAHLIKLLFTTGTNN